MRRVRSVFVLAVVLIIAGIALTLENIGAISGASKLWPLFPLIVGAGFLMLFSERGRGDLALLFLGIVLVLCALFFFYLNYTTWRMTATLWPVFLGITGTGFLGMFMSSRVRLFLYLGSGLIMLATVFFLVFGVSLHLWPLSLVAFGASLLVVNYYYVKR
ncbi:MAG: hypothetical protein JW768_01675 [Chitinispirillaceae bacterium]|nr:hypothetical protein [Chitinispirillaceae bacterium]